jgi:hypothetical protein
MSAMLTLRTSRRLIVALLVAMGVLAGSHPGRADEPKVRESKPAEVKTAEPKPYEKITIDEIVAAWKARHDAVNSVRFHVKETKVVPKGSTSGSRGRIKDDEGRPFPPKDLTLKAEWDVVISGDSYRFERFGDEWNRQGEKVIVEHYLDLSDGKRDLSFQGREERTNSLHSRAFNYPLTGKAALKEHAMEGSSAWLIFHTFRSQMSRFGPYDSTAWRLTPKLATIDGRRCLSLQNIKSAEVQAFNLLWVDPERNFIVLRHEVGHNEKIRWQMDFRYSLDEASGFWTPHDWTGEYYLEDGAGRPRLSEGFQCTVAGYELNPMIDASEFQFELPEGTEVMDYTGGGPTSSVSLITASGHRPVTDDEKRRGARYSDLLQTSSGQALAVDEGGFAWTYVAAFAAVIGLIWAWKRRH